MRLGDPKIMNSTRADKLVLFIQIFISNHGFVKIMKLDFIEDGILIWIKIKDFVTRLEEMRWSSLDIEYVEMPSEEEATQDCSRGLLAATYKPSSKLVKGSNSKDRGER